MDRRQFLAALGASSLLAGCGSGLPNTTPTPTNSPSETRPLTPTESGRVRHPGEPFETEDGYSVTVSNLRVQRSFIAYRSPHTYVLAESNHQYLVFDRLIDGRGFPSSSRTGVLLEGRGYFGVEAAPSGSRTPEHSTLGIRVPAEQFERGSIVWNRPDVYGPAVRWVLPESVLADIDTPPQFEVRAFTLPDTALDGSTFRISVEIANTGSRDGVFRAELGSADLSDRPEFTVGVDAGSTATHTRQHHADFRGRDTLTLVLEWGTGELERTVEKKSR